MDKDREKTLRKISSAAELKKEFPLVIETDVAWGEMDAYQHVNNGVYFRYFENVRVAYMAQSGWAAIEEKTGVEIIVRRIEASYHMPLEFPCHYLLAARVPIETIERDRFEMEYAIGIADEEGKFIIATSGSSENVLFNYKADPPKKAEMTEDIKKLLIDFESRPR